jgi:hypothetical protein
VTWYGFKARTILVYINHRLPTNTVDVLCGSSLGEILSEEDSFPIAANTLDADIKLPNQFHEFTKEAPSWYKIGDNAKQYEGHPV